MTGFGRYHDYVRRLTRAVLTSAAVTEPPRRQAIEDRAAALGGSTAPRPSQELPALLDGYVTKVGLHAYQITDGDVEALERAGYSEDAIFEITLCAAVGAARGRLERGLWALKGVTP